MQLLVKKIQSQNDVRHNVVDYSHRINWPVEDDKIDNKYEKQPPGYFKPYISLQTKFNTAKTSRLESICDFVNIFIYKPYSHSTVIHKHESIIEKHGLSNFINYHQSENPW